MPANPQGSVRLSAIGVLLLGLLVAAAVASSSAAGTHPKGATHPKGGAHAKRHARKPNNCPRKLSRCPLRLKRKPHVILPGVNDDWHVRPGELADATRLGGRLIRFPFTWMTVQPDGPQTWNWAVYDRIFAAARAQGLGVILEPSQAPCWAHPETDCPPGLTPEPPNALHQVAWQTFIRRALQRYDNIVAVEAWNEPNVSSFWLGGPDPTRYTSLLQATYTAVKSVRPDVPVLFGGVAPFTPNAPLEGGYIDFLRKAYAAGAAGYFDALALHPYAIPYNRPDYRERILGVIARARRVTWQAERRVVPIWITEAGFSTAGSGAVSEQAQAGRFAAVYKLLARVPRLPVVVLHRFFDQPGAGYQENGFGVVRPDLSAKPSYRAVQWDFTHFSHPAQR